MTTSEVYPNPTVKEVVFEIQFPNLFFLESKIGDFQEKIMKDFSESSLLFEQKIVISNVGEGVNIKDIPELQGGAMARKIWQFVSPEKQCKVTVKTDSISISSEFYKTYDNASHVNKFRDVIKTVVDSFLQVAKIPVFHRIGLRYIDLCPIVEKSNESFSASYKTTFPLDRFNLADAEEMLYRTVVKKGSYKLIFMEALKKLDDTKWQLILDFDGIAESSESKDYLEVADRLHTLISEEYLESIKEPIIEIMRGNNPNE